MATFERPAGLAFPTTYYTFKAKDKGSENVVEYRVQDLPEDRFEDALDLLVNHFMPDEELNISRGLLNSPEGVKEHRELWHDMMRRKLSIACFKNDGSPELVGVNVLVVNSQDDAEEELNIKDDALIDILAVLDYTAQQFNVFEHFKVNRYLSAYGLVVNDKYRGRGVATEMLKARAPLLKALDLSLTSTAFTGVGSQIAAKRAGYEEVFAIKYADLKNASPQFSFISTKAEFFKMMVLKV